MSSSALPSLQAQRRSTLLLTRSLLLSSGFYSWPIRVKYEQTIGDVKAAVSARLGVPVDQQQLFWHKKELTGAYDHKILLEMNMHTGFALKGYDLVSERLVDKEPVMTRTQVSVRVSVHILRCGSWPSSRWWVLMHHTRTYLAPRSRASGVSVMGCSCCACGSLSCLVDTVYFPLFQSTHADRLDGVMPRLLHGCKPSCAVVSLVIQRIQYCMRNQA